MKFIKDNFKWDMKQFIKSGLGVLLFCLAINIFIVPTKLYNGGILGLSQLIRSLIVSVCDIDFKIDIAGIINFIINIPLFILAYKKISKTFFARTFYCIALQTIFFTIIPVSNTPIMDEVITNVLIGSLIAGIGCGITLTCGASGGGTEIIGVYASKKSRNLSVGKIGLVFNLFIYIICGICYGLPIMIYSIIYSILATLIIDNTHEQNICSTAIIFTKEKPDRIIEFVKNELDRDATYWQATGGYSNSTTYISYVVLSKYELLRLESNLNKLDKHAFLVKSSGVGIDGNFKKNL